MSTVRVNFNLDRKTYDKMRGAVNTSLRSAWIRENVRKALETPKLFDNIVGTRSEVQTNYYSSKTEARCTANIDVHLYNSVSRRYKQVGVFITLLVNHLLKEEAK